LRGKALDLMKNLVPRPGFEVRKNPFFIGFFERQPAASCPTDFEQLRMSEIGLIAQRSSQKSLAAFCCPALATRRQSRDE
jgi:hypothetical protein